MAQSVKPYHSEGSKKEQVAEMFDNISRRYDFLNHLLSLNIDKAWRKKVLKRVAEQEAKSVLDVATGTADLALALGKQGVAEVIGVDISAGMLAVGQRKVERLKLGEKVRLDLGDSEDLPYPDDRFDAITVAFGVRNFENLNQGLREMHRVLKPDGVLLVLEFSQPQSFPFKQLYRFYFKRILPNLGRLVSRDARAYTYLPESVDAFPYGEAFEQELKRAGYRDLRSKALTFGVATLYEGRK
jgi:ubiquinone/menaquinone biosynthesis methyltransferases